MGTALRKGPGPPQDRWSGTRVTALLLTAARKNKLRREKRGGEPQHLKMGERSGLNLLPEGHHNQDETMESHLLSKQQGMKTRYDVPDERKNQTS